MTTAAWWIAAAVLVIAASVWPRDGLIARAQRRARRRAREHGENALKHLLKETQAGRAGTFASLKGTLRIGDRALLRVLERLRASGLTASDGGSYTLTPSGEQRARHLVRAHRLIERYLADEARLPLTSVHRVAERLEHRLSEADADRLSASLGHPERDPHGDPIPSAGEGSPDTGAPITGFAVGEEGRIVHLEDEPPATFRALVHLGLAPGQPFRVLARSDDAMRLHVEDADCELPLEHAGNVFAAPLEGPAHESDGLLRLSDVEVMQAVEIVALSPTCQGFTRRRLLDLGFTPGTRAQPVLQTFVGDPRAYRVRGTTIALRRDQSSVVLVRPVVEAMVGADPRAAQAGRVGEAAPP